MILGSFTGFCCGLNTHLDYSLDVLLLDTCSLDLPPERGDGEDLHVAGVGEHGQVVLQVALVAAGPEPNQRHLAHLGALVRRQLVLQGSLQCRQRENLQRQMMRVRIKVQE